jgi:hypothetical protein
MDGVVADLAQEEPSSQGGIHFYLEERDDDTNIIIVRRQTFNVNIPRFTVVSLGASTMADRIADAFSVPTMGIDLPQRHLELDRWWEIVAITEQLIRLSWYQVDVDMKSTLISRLRYAQQHACIHIQEDSRPKLNPELYGADGLRVLPPGRHVAQAITNIFRIEVVVNEKRSRWLAGEKHTSGHQWWYTEQSDKVFFLPADDEVRLRESIADAAAFIIRYEILSKRCSQRDKALLQDGSVRQAPSLKSPSKYRYAPMSEVQLCDKLRKVTEDCKVKWDWLEGSNTAVRLPSRENYTKFFSEIGFALFLFATGSELDDIINEAHALWKSSVKFNIDNQFEMEWVDKRRDNRKSTPGDRCQKI